MRIPFEEAISEPLLLKNWFYGEGTKTNPGLSLPQQVGLKAFYGLPLNEEELKIWAIFQESCSYDPLGYASNIAPVPYNPKEYSQLTAVVGRRSGKTASWLATILTYEMLLGGHDEYRAKGQSCIGYMVAHRMPVAIENMGFIRQVIESSPVLKNEVEAYNSEKYLLKSGLAIVPSPPSMKAQRGLAVPVVCGDESGFWYTDSDSANPDFEVERAVEYAMAQFPHSKMVWASTPWTREGVLWKYFNAGTEGRKLPLGNDKSEFKGCLLLHASTAAMQNPRISKERLTRLLTRDPQAYERESLARFVDSVSGFFSADALKTTISSGLGIRKLDKKENIKYNYVAAIDPAFRHDSFAFTILHKDPEQGIVQDVVRRFTPLHNISRLNPLEVLGEISQDLKEYGVKILYSDQYQLESLQQLAMQMGLVIIGMDFTGKSKAKMFGNLQKLVDQKKLHLLDPSVSEAARQQFYELQILERKLGSGGTVQISAPEGKHDDMACVLALAASAAMHQDPEVVPPPKKPPTLEERVQKDIKRRRLYGYLG